MRRHIAVVVALALGFVAMGASGSSALADEQGQSARVVPIMTQNMDEGTGFGPLLTAGTFTDLLSAVAATYDEVQASNIPERSAAVAREIGAKRPTLVALQEASLWRTGPLFAPPATNVAFDQLQSVLDALHEQGLHYTAIAVQTELDAELPSSLGFDVRVTDRNVVLARSDLRVSQLKVLGVHLQNYQAQFTVPTAAGPVTVPRGWIAVDAQIRGTAYRFITTHLEAASAAIQVAQGNELLHGPANTALPLVVAGDFNSAASGGPDPSTTYNNLVSAGLRDAWSLVSTHQGFTWPLHGEDPYTPIATPSERIDLVLINNGVAVFRATRIGNTTAERTPSGLWPSDHAGVAATLLMPDTP
jgi:endonuclease/exonuclease/phosphatase family metal-dependent hydrolase